MKYNTGPSKDTLTATSNTKQQLITNSHSSNIRLNLVEVVLVCDANKITSAKISILIQHENQLLSGNNKSRRCSNTSHLGTQRLSSFTNLSTSVSPSSSSSCSLAV